MENPVENIQFEAAKKLNKTQTKILTILLGVTYNSYRHEVLSKLIRRGEKKFQEAVNPLIENGLLEFCRQGFTGQMVYRLTKEGFLFSRELLKTQFKES
jgi:hypothetical protein